MDTKQEQSNMEEKALTFGQKAVGIRFNPSELSSVDKSKQGFADLIDQVNDLPQGDKPGYLSNTFKGMAIRSCIIAQMAAVKFLTWNHAD